MRCLRCVLPALLSLGAACDQSPAADQAPTPGTVRWVPSGGTGDQAAIRLLLSPDGDSVVLRDGATQAIRGVVRSAGERADLDGVCAMVAAGAGALARVQHALPIDTTAPWLAVTRLETDALVGTRTLLPGARAIYLFEGVFRGSRRRVSLQWPVVSAQAIPAGAPVAVLEQAITPTAEELDSLVLGLSEEGGWEVLAELPPAAPDPKQATPLVGDLPIHEVRLEAPCTRLTLALPVIARVDKVVRIPVEAGDTITALARLDEGTVRVAFDEAPSAPEPRERRSIPAARVVAGADGRVTLRIRVQVVPRAQATGQLVTLLLDRHQGR